MYPHRTAGRLQNIGPPAQPGKAATTKQARKRLIRRVANVDNQSEHAPD
jgi:hypothetical protein